MGLRCKLFGHKWIGCICLICGETREHEWNGCICVNCGETREHEWNGCICVNCGKTREHEWNGCTCTRCGSVNSLDHNYVNVPEKCVTVCSICGKEGGVQHEWNDGKCAKCGQSKEQFEFFTEMIALIEVEYERLFDEIRLRSTIFDYTDHEIIHTIHQVRQKIKDKYGQAGLEKMLEMIHEEHSGILASIVEENWQEISTTI